MLGHDQVGETAVHGVERLLELVHERGLGGTADEVHQHFGIGVRVENRALVLEFAAQRGAVGQIAVVAQGHIAVMETEDERLDVVAAAGTGRGVTHVTDGVASFKPLNFAFVAEHLSEQAFAAVADQVAVVVRHDAGAFLPAMLQSV